LKTQKIELVKD